MTNDEKIRLAALRSEVELSGWFLVVKKTDETKRSDTTLAADSALKFIMAASSFYQIRGKVFYDSSSAADLKWRHSGPASPTMVRMMRRNYACGDTAISDEAVDTAYSSSDIVLDGSASTGGFIEFEGFVSNGSTEGTWEFKWAQNTSDATDSKVLKGSYIEYRQIA